jgi:hypothetical protein
LAAARITRALTSPLSHLEGILAVAESFVGGCRALRREQMAVLG